MKKKVYFLLASIVFVGVLTAQKNIDSNKINNVSNNKLLLNNAFNLKEKKWSVEVDFSKPLFAIVSNKFSNFLKKITLESNIQSYEMAVTKINPLKKSESRLALIYFNLKFEDNSIFKQYQFFPQYNVSIISFGYDHRKYLNNSNFYYIKSLGILYTKGDVESELISETNYKKSQQSFNFFIGSGIGFKKNILKSNVTFGFEVKPYFSIFDIINYKANEKFSNPSNQFSFDIEFLRIGYIFK